MRRLKIGLLSLAVLLLSACGDATSRDVHLLSGAAPAELARTHLAAAALKQQNFNVTIEEARLGQIWQRLWAGKADASVTVWLPQASAPFVERFFDRLDDLGPKDGRLAAEADLWPAKDKPHTLVRRSLAQDAPQAVALLKDLQWQPADIEQIIERWQQSQNWTLAAESWLAEQASSSVDVRQE
ncbi:glycine betaine ABC transporter substrate-binding protein [Oceanisphaera sp. IT1-181]|uniref:glycine betaine ABC transporter substrate-binding protein n=1 Tax=Oceanisphaera sp. IT1-181 TaxID=3081199 RepID=UPI0029CA302A|nr:glycine betaine ABC transporter substrate-binding protein [Oceanisphaera sp. IT1-181]